MVRRREARFLAEGPNLVEAALRRGLVSEVFATESALSRFGAMLTGAPVHLVTERAAKALSETVTPVGLVAVCSVPDVGLADVIADGPRLVAVAVEISEPGNAGTLIRIADAMGADAVVLAGHSVDPYNGKCLRASAGSIFSIPVVSEPARRRRRRHAERRRPAGAGHHCRRRGQSRRRGPGRADGVAVRAGITRPAKRIGGHGHSPGSHPDAGQRRKPECGVRRLDLPVPKRAGAPNVTRWR